MDMQASAPLIRGGGGEESHQKVKSPLTSLYIPVHVVRWGWACTRISRGSLACSRRRSLPPPPFHSFASVVSALTDGQTSGARGLGSWRVAAVWGISPTLVHPWWEGDDNNVHGNGSGTRYGRYTGRYFPRCRPWGEVRSVKSGMGRGTCAAVTLIYPRHARSLVGWDEKEGWVVVYCTIVDDKRCSTLGR
jgi:hypothetical protein